LTGVGVDEEGDGLGLGLGVLGVLSVLPELPDPVPPELGPVEPPPDGVVFLRLLVLGVLLELAGLSFGREVRNAPRTSSSS